MASKLAIDITLAIKRKYKVGNSSGFCDEGPDWDEATDLEIATLIDAELSAYYNEPREKLRLLQERLKKSLDAKPASEEVASSTAKTKRFERPSEPAKTCKVSWPGTKMDDSDRQFCGRPLPCALHQTGMDPKPRGSWDH